MDHGEAVRQKATERYLLDEFAPEERERFEEHLFDCPDCALDVRATALFIEQSKDVFAQDSKKTSKVSVDAADRKRSGWLAWLRMKWLRPAFAVPALAALLAVIAYQNFVQLPGLQVAANRAHILPATSINLLTRGSGPTPLVIHPGQAFLLNVIIPSGPRQSSYEVDLYNPKGKLELSLPVKTSADGAASDAASLDGTWPIQVPGANREGGIYKLAVLSTTAEGKQVEVGQGSFELQIQQ